MKPCVIRDITKECTHACEEIARALIVDCPSEIEFRPVGNSEIFNAMLHGVGAEIATRPGSKGTI